MTTITGALAREGALATAHAALQLWVGALVGGALVVAVPLGVGLVPAAGAGLAVLAGVLLAARALAVVERARFAAVLGVRLGAPPAGRTPAAPGRWARLLAVLRAASTWRSLAWAALLGPVGLAEGVLVLGLWALALAGITLPAWVATAPTDGWLRAGGPAGVVVGVVVGALLVPAALATARVCAAADTALARRLLAEPPTARLRAQVAALDERRSAAVEAADAERRRIERDLHDGAQQRLVALALDLGMAAARLDADPAGARELVVHAHAEAKAAVAELRDLARGIHPAVLTDRGLDAALSALAARCPVPVAIAVELPQRCAPAVEATAYFVVSEALANTAKHAGATRAQVDARRVSGDLVVRVTDDGVGGAALGGGGTGLAGLSRRVAAAGGRLRVSSPAGGPTVVEAVLPCAS